MEFSKSERTHDAFYVNEDSFKNPKEAFKKTVNLIKNVPFEGLLTNPETILDIGSAAGDFLRYLEFENSNFTLKSFYGIDVMDS